MANLTIEMRSELLHRTVEVQCYLPSDLPADVGWETKGVLTLLHGYEGGANVWMHMTAAARYAADNGLALVCPACGNSFYQNMAAGEQWRSFVTEEMPELLARMLRLPRAREKNWIAGLSMGGYGALYLGLSRPDLYAGCASFSGTVDVKALALHAEESGFREVFQAAFGSDGQPPEAAQVFELMRRTAKLPAQQQPVILQTCGTEDTPLYDILGQNRALQKACSALPLAHYRYMEWPGVHEWNFWDRSLVYAMDAFLQNGYAARNLSAWRTEPRVL